MNAYVELTKRVGGFTIESNKCCLRHEGLSTIPFIPRILAMRALHEIHILTFVEQSTARFKIENSSSP